MPCTDSKTKKLIVLPDGEASEDNQSHERHCDTASSDDRGPGGPDLVSGKDEARLAHSEMLRDSVLDSLARHLWQDGLPARAVPNTHVFCSVFFRRLFKEGPEAVEAVAKRTNIFSA